MPRRCPGIGLLMLSATFAASTALAEPPRNFGYFIGDLITQQLPLRADGENLELVEAPPDQRVGRWLRRLSSTSYRDEAGRSWLQLEYQVINAPREPVTIALPGLNLEVVDGEPFKSDPVPVSISPLTPAAVAGDGELPSIRPDRPPSPPDTAVAVRRLLYCGIALVITLTAWLGWWLWWLYARTGRLPFADAFHSLRGLEATRLDENPDAWLALHRAFNATAGRSVTGSNMGVLFRRAPWLAPQRLRIEEFYKSSALRFFAQQPQPSPFSLIEFGRELYRAEKRQADARQPREQR